MTRPRPLQHLFDSGVTRQLFERAHYLQRLTAAVSSCLDPETATHLQVAADKEHSLVLLTDSPAWATRLRYQVPQLLRCLTRQAQLAHLQGIEVKVAPLDTVSRQTPPQDCNLSRDSAELITAHAESIDYPPLRAALLRLAHRGK